jgi:hypothetical protein
VTLRALGRRRPRVGRRLDGDLHHAGEEEVVLAGVGADPLLPVVAEVAGAVHQVHGLLLRADPDVAGQLAHGGTRVREALDHAILVAPHLARSCAAILLLCFLRS